MAWQNPPRVTNDASLQDASIEGGEVPHGFTMGCNGSSRCDGEGKFVSMASFQDAKIFFDPSSGGVGRCATSTTGYSLRNLRFLLMTKHQAPRTKNQAHLLPFSIYKILVIL